MNQPGTHQTASSHPSTAEENPSTRHLLAALCIELSRWKSQRLAEPQKFGKPTNLLEYQGLSASINTASIDAVQKTLQPPLIVAIFLPSNLPEHELKVHRLLIDTDGHGTPSASSQITHTLSISRPIFTYLTRRQKNFKSNGQSALFERPSAGSINLRYSLRIRTCSDNIRFKETPVVSCKTASTSSAEVVSILSTLPSTTSAC